MTILLHRISRRFSPTIVFITALVLISQTVHAQKIVDLFTPLSTSSTQSKTSTPSSPYVEKSQKVGMDLADFHSLNVGDTINLLMFNEEVSVEVTRINTEGRQKKLIQAKSFDGQQKAFLIQKDSSFIGQIISTSNTFEFQQESPGVVNIDQLDMDFFSDKLAHDSFLHLDPERLKTTNSVQQAPQVPTSSEDGSIIDVIIAYEPEVVSPEARIELLTARANESFENSNIDLKFRIVHSYESTDVITEEDAQADITAFISRNDGRFDEIHELKTAYRADIAVLLTADFPQTLSNGRFVCGIAPVNAPDFAAFALVSNRCLAQLTFHHELGHIMGAGHDLGDTTAVEAFPYGHGFCNRQNASRTMMATSCSLFGRENLWSGPESIFEDFVMGNAETADNTRVIRENAARVANFQQSMRAEGDERIFERFGPGSRLDNQTIFPWKLTSRPTKTPGTGPDSAAGGAGYYAYVETSGDYANDSGETAIIRYDAGSNGQINTFTYEFDYYMHGRDIGTLYLEQATPGGWSVLWSASGEQHPSSFLAWTPVSVTSRGFGSIRFRAVAAGGSLGDIAIDNVRIVAESPRPSPTPSATPLPRSILLARDAPLHNSLPTSSTRFIHQRCRWEFQSDTVGVVSYQLFCNNQRYATLSRYRRGNIINETRACKLDNLRSGVRVTGVSGNAGGTCQFTLRGPL